jgi:hypothetical protein
MVSTARATLEKTFVLRAQRLRIGQPCNVYASTVLQDSKGIAVLNPTVLRLYKTTVRVPILPLTVP